MSGPILPLNGFTLISMAIPNVVGSIIKHRLAPKDSKQEDNNEFEETLSVARSMIHKLSQYAIEDLQRLSSTFQPTPWTVRVIRASIPASTCSIAAEYLMTAFGPHELETVVGGRQWWQLRDKKDGSIPGEWIAMKRDLARSSSTRSNSPGAKSPSTPGFAGQTSRSRSPPEARQKNRKSLLGSIRRRQRQADKPLRNESPNEYSTFLGAEQSNAAGEQPPASFSRSSRHTAPHESDHAAQNLPNISTSPEREFTNDQYEDDLDKMPCMLYIHGGAYYFGSIHTHRYMIWRYARKMRGRAFAVDYRLAPQYPFPCALADCLAAYIYLIRPPEEAKHRPIDPSKIVIAGDSAGGGLTLALLTLIRDVGLPLPAGGVLVSPWLDLAHSFPSIMTNGDKDIIPTHGFVHQPSTLWPPPSPISGTCSLKPTNPTSPSQPHPPSSTSGPQSPSSPNSAQDYLPFKPKLCPELKSRIDEANGFAEVVDFPDGQSVAMNVQTQYYATNEQINHPFCSPIVAPSLGGLPPLFIMAGQNEVLRDEIIYAAHRAAHPQRYPLREDLLNANPERKAKAAEYPPTKVHLQVYDGTFHVLPMFPFLRPAKYCYRAISSFCKFVTDSDQRTDLAPQNSSADDAAPDTNPIPGFDADDQGSPPGQPPSSPAPADVARSPSPVTPGASGKLPSRSLSKATRNELQHTIYHALLPHRRPPFVDGMIRERVAVDGKIRPMEDESTMEVLQIPPEEVGMIKVGPLKKWANGVQTFDQKFRRKYRQIQSQRESQIKRSIKRTKQPKKDKHQSTQADEQEQPSCQPDGEAETTNHNNAPHTDDEDSTREIEGIPGTKQTVGNASRRQTSMARVNWTLSEEERPPPGSIAARQDTAQALKLAKALERQHDLVEHSPFHNVKKASRADNNQ